MNEYLEMYNTLDSVSKIYWICAIIGTVVFAVQLLLTLIGMDSSDIDVDFDGSDTLDMGNGISLFTIRNLINFIVGFGWAGICLKEAISSPILLGIVSILVGVAFVMMFFFIRKQTKKLEHNGAYRIENCVGMTVSVYLHVPAARQGSGKVQVSFDGSVQEINAITDGNEIPSGTHVKVLEVIDSNTLLVQ